jgi:hypothetical protein
MEIRHTELNTTTFKAVSRRDRSQPTVCNARPLAALPTTPHREPDSEESTASRKGSPKGFPHCFLSTRSQYASGAKLHSRKD